MQGLRLERQRRRLERGRRVEQLGRDVVGRPELGLGEQRQRQLVVGEHGRRRGRRRDVQPAIEALPAGPGRRHCAASCTASEITMCTSDGECSAGKTCTPFRTKGAQVGACE